MAVARSGISVLIHTKNAAETIESAIKSVMNWADEVVVADMQSEDDTIKLAKNLGAVVIKYPDHGFADPVRNDAISKVQGPWVLVLDADEEIPPTLATELQKRAQDMSVHAYELPRKNLIFGKWAKTGWWPDYIIRFFQKGYVDWPAKVHGQPVAKGTIGRFDADESLAILHHNYTTVHEFIDRMNRYTDLELGTGKKSLIKTASDEFLRRYFDQRGYSQGEYGLILSSLQTMYMMVAIIKQREQSGFSLEKTQESFRQFEDDIDEVFRDLCYWIADTHVRTERSWFSRLYWKVRRKLRV
ncbi:MAG TPA: glycosyltransferase family 2 protein [Patescibacteria group bacterium]|nr:glycosyltransferase family 2 protein [Patescibacteria group bacterium]